MHKVLRSFSKSEFDQAFMIVVTHRSKSHKKVVNLLEVDRETHYAKMVPLKSIDDIRFYLETNKEMVHRKLVDVDRAKDFDDNINEDVVHSLVEIINEESKEHLKYHQPLTNHENNAHTHYDEKEPLKFHSIEVLVKVYQSIGLLDKLENPLAFTPNHFAQKFDLPLLKGRLSNEKVVSLPDSHLDGE